MTEPQANRFHRSSLSITDNELWCFWFVTLFNLQGTRPRSLGAEALLSYHIQPALSSTFFNFFRSSSALSRPVSLRQLAYSTRIGTVCQALFFASFQVFLSCSPRQPLVPDSLINIAGPGQFVKGVFSLFSSFFLTVRQCSPTARCFLY